METAKHIGGEFSQIITKIQLREICLGEFQGKSIKEIQEHDVLDLRTKWNKFTRCSTFPAPMGESRKDFHNRSVEALYDIVVGAAKHADHYGDSPSLGQSQVILVTHGGVLKSIYRHIKSANCHVRVPLCDNCSISIIKCNVDFETITSWEICDWNFNDHLKQFQ